MAERPSAAQLVSLGVQTAPGTPASPTKVLGSAGLSFQPQVETRITRPAGAKYPTGVVLGREWMTLGISGDATYEDLLYLLTSALGNGVETTGTAAFSPRQAAVDDVEYFTIRKGDATEGEQTADAVVTDFGVAFSREAVELSGSLIGKAMTMDVAQPTLSYLPVSVIDPNDICVYWVQTSTDGTAPAKLLRALRGSWNVAGKQNPLWVLDCAQASYAAIVEGSAPAISCTLQLEADDPGLNFVDYLRTADDGWLEFRINEPADPKYASFKTHAMVSGIGELGDQDGVYAYEVTFEGTHDSTWGKATEVKVKSGTTMPT